MSRNLHYAAAPRDRCQSLPKVRHAARHCQRFMSQVWHVVRQMSQVYVTGLACGASDVTGLCHRFGMWCVRCHRFGMWCVRCHRFMSQVWHVVRQMSQVYVTGLACGASDVTGLCYRFGMCNDTEDIFKGLSILIITQKLIIINTNHGHFIWNKHIFSSQLKKTYSIK